jgi:undecaprenyl diphosphate synthase
MHAQPTTIPINLHRAEPNSPQAPIAPDHVGLVLTGIRLWAKRNGHPCGMAIFRSTQRCIDAVTYCLQHGIAELTLYMFTDEVPPSERERQVLLTLLLRNLPSMTAALRRKGVGLRIIGDTETMPEELSRQLLEAESSLANSQRHRLQLNIALDGARDWDMPKALAEWQASAGGKLPSGNGAASLQPFVLKAQSADPKLVIRAGGEIPMDVHIVWDTQATALYYMDTLWPDFGTHHMSKALHWFQQENRPGGVLLRQARKGIA